jgi:uncharacterized protein (TIGR03083 family)
MSDLIDVWHESLEQILDLCEPLDDAQWNTPSPCPGWTVGDVVAHLVDVEALLAGDPRPTHEPDWSQLPHVKTEFGRLTEVGVDARRSQGKREVMEELRAILDRRDTSLRSHTGPVRGVFGHMMDLDQLLGMRIFDCWVHEQDIRIALGLPGGLDSSAAQVSAAAMVNGLAKAWGKTIAPPPGSVLRVTITGPVIERDVALVIDADGRAVWTDPAAADVHITLGWPDYLLAATGRIDTDEPEWRTGVAAIGDKQLVDRTLRALNVAP